MTSTVTFEVDHTSVAMPVVVRDAAAATVMYDVDLAAARALAPSGFEIVETAPGRAQLTLALVDYRDNDLGAYLEVGVILFVRPIGGGEDGTFIRHLPVSERFTCLAGLQIWGFPKTVEQIDVEEGQGTWTWTLTMDGELVLRVTVPRGGDDEMPVTAMTTYTLKDGVPHATRFSQGGADSALDFAPAIDLELGTHRIAEELRSLGLPAAPVVLSTWTGRMQGRFETPQPLG